MRFPPPAQFFDYLANNKIYPIIEDIYKVKSKESQGKVPIEKEIFPKFANVDDADGFREVLEREFNDQRRRVLAAVGPKGREKQYESSAELYSTMWDRLSKFLEEKGVARSRPQSARETIETFIENPKDYQKFYDYIRKTIGDSESSKGKNVENLKVRILGEDRVGILLEIMQKNYTGSSPPTLEEFYTDDFPYFNYVALEISMTRISDDKKAPEGWEIQRNLAGDDADFVKFTKILRNDAKEITDAKERRKLIAQLRDAIVEMTEKDVKIGENEVMEAYVPKDKQIQYQSTINYPLMYEILVQSDRKLTTKTLKLTTALETSLELKGGSDDEKISAYFDVMEDRDGVISKILLFSIREEALLPYFSKAKGSSKYFPPHRSLEKILTKGLSSAISDVVADSIISEKGFISSKERSKKIKFKGEELQRIKEERRKLLQDIKIYDKKTLLTLFNGARTGRVKKKFAKYGKYITESNQIDLNTDIFSGNFGNIGEKLVPVSEATAYATSNKTLQNTLDKDLQLMFEDYRVNDDEDLEDNNRLFFNNATKTVSLRAGTKLEDNELSLDEQEGDKDTTFAKVEERALYSLVKSVEKGELLSLVKGDIKFTGKLTQADLFEYGFILSQDLLDKDYDADKEKLEELRKEDSSTNNEELVSEIKQFAAKLDNDLKQLKKEFVGELDRKLQDIVESRGRYKNLYGTDAGQKLISIMVRNNLLNRGKK